MRVLSACFARPSHPWRARSQAEDAREKAAAAAADAAKLAAQAQVLGREAKLGRELRDDNYRLEESLHT